MSGDGPEPRVLFPALPDGGRSLLGKVSELALRHRRAAAAALGTHPTRLAGSGGLPLAARPYLQGDDARQLDWKRWARSDMPHVVEREREGARTLCLVLDDSASMAHPDVAPPWEAAVDVASLLGWLALRRGDAVVVHPASRERVSPATAGRGTETRLRAAVVAGRPAGRPDLARAVARALGPGGGSARAAVLVSDLLIPPEALTAALRALGRAGGGAAVVWVHDPVGEDPASLGAGGAAVVAVDSETGERRLVDTGASASRAAAEARAARVRALATACRDFGIARARLPVRGTDREAALLAVAAALARTGLLDRGRG